MTELINNGKKLATRLLRSISLSLGKDVGFLDNIHQGMMLQGCDDSVENSTTLRSLFYPPISDETAQQPSVIRLRITNLIGRCIMFNFKMWRTLGLRDNYSAFSRQSWRTGG